MKVCENILLIFKNFEHLFMFCFVSIFTWCLETDDMYFSCEITQSIF